MKNKKAQGLPMNTIVIAALVLVVMVVLILIFTGNIGGWVGDVDKTETSAMARAECLGKGGIVKENCDDKTEKSTPIDDLGTNLKCCVKKILTPKEKCEAAGGYQSGTICSSGQKTIPITGIEGWCCG